MQARFTADELQKIEAGLTLTYVQFPWEREGIRVLLIKVNDLLGQAYQVETVREPGSSERWG